MRTMSFARILACTAVMLGLTAEAHAVDPIRIGVVLTTTGAASYLGEPEAKTLKIYVDQINAAGGVLGRKIETIVYDDGGDANKARTFATRLVEQDGVKLVIGGSTTGTTMAMLPIFEESETLFMSLAGGVSIIEPPRKWVFKTPHTDRMGCEKIFADLKARKLTRIALIAGTDGFGASMRTQCLQVAPNYGVEIAVDLSYGAQDTDMTPQLTTVKGTNGIQAIVNTGASGQGPAILTRNYGQLGMQNIPLYQNPGVASKSFIKLSGPAAEGVRLPAAALLIADKLADSDPQKKVVLDYQRTYETAAKDPVSTFGGGAYDGLMLFIDAIKRANSAEASSIRDALENTKGFIGTAGIVNMGPKDHLGLTLNAFHMLVIKDGDWQIVE